MKYRIRTNGKVIYVQRKWVWLIFWGWNYVFSESIAFSPSELINFATEAKAEEYAKEHFGSDRKRVRKMKTM